MFRIIQRLCISRRDARQHTVSLRYLSTNGGATFSTAWESVDSTITDVDDDPLQTPDPTEYLKGFDQVDAIQSYKDALFEACDLRETDHFLDVGCGTAMHTPLYSNAVGATGRVVGIDASRTTIETAKATYGDLQNTAFQVANVYDLPFSSGTFHVVKEDRVLQHLMRPLEAVQEMLRVSKPGGSVVVSNPDFRTFQFDVTGAGRGEQYKRFGDRRRPPDELNFDIGDLTMKVLNGVVPTLSAHSYIGLAQARLLKAAGARDIELNVVPVTLIGRQNLEAVVPISYMARLSVDNGAISEEEMKIWLERLEWEGHENMLGTLNFYICRGVKPHSSGDYGDDETPTRPQKLIGTVIFPNKSAKPKHDVAVRFASAKNDSVDLLQQATDLINNEYAQSDTGSTLSSTRVALCDVEYMVKNHQLIFAMDDSTSELLGCIQVQIKDDDDSKSKDTGEVKTGLPDVSSNEEKCAEFTCLAVRSASRNTVTGANTQHVSIQKDEGSTQSAQGRGIGAALVRKAEAYAREQGCDKMLLGIMCPAHGEMPIYKQWLHGYYLSLGYEHRSTLCLEFEQDHEGSVIVDQLHDMYEPLHQLVPCKAILFDKKL